MTGTGTTAVANGARDLFHRLAARPFSGAALASDGPQTGHAHFGKLAPQGDVRAPWREMAQAGWLGPLVAEEREGLGLTEADLLAVARCWPFWPDRSAMAT